METGTIALVVAAFTLLVLVGYIGFSILAKFVVAAVEVAEADKSARRTIKKLIETGNDERLEKLRRAVKETGPQGLAKFERIEKELREEVASKTIVFE